MPNRLSKLPSLETATRSLLLFLALFSLLNLLGGLLRPRFDATVWWIDLSFVPHPYSLATIAIVTAAMLLYAFDRAAGRILRPVVIAALLLAFVVTLLNVGTFLLLVSRGGVDSMFPVPFSLLPAVALAAALRDLTRRRDRTLRPLLSPTISLCVALLFPLLQIFCFGMSDYARPADAIVVFGARAYADGRLSTALSDRIETACRLYHEGRASVMILSGGPGDGAIHESEAMRSYALARGIPDSAIIVDLGGLSTALTVENCSEMFRKNGIRRTIAVSHFYHLPRIKLAFQRAGILAYTVPADESGTFSGTPQQLLREVAGLYIYYLAPLLSRGEGRESGSRESADQG